VAGALLLWEVAARSELLPRALAPNSRAILGALWRMAADGTLAMHVSWTLGRVLVGLAIAGAFGIPIGLLMGRFRLLQRLVAPIVNALMPIPSLAWVPVLILWFGLGNTATIALIVYAATFVLIHNAWAGVRAVNPIWIRSAVAMGADERMLFWRVVLPGALPYVITGVRLAFARSWIAVVGGEMIAATQWGLGWVIFDSREFLSADVMMAALLIIGLLGLLFERYAFQPIEQHTVARWGMVRAAAS
jgi:NitT/TauT family transport system permease protein